MEDMKRDPNGYSPSDIVNRLVNIIHLYKDVKIIQIN